MRCTSLQHIIIYFCGGAIRIPTAQFTMTNKYSHMYSILCLKHRNPFGLAGVESYCGLLLQVCAKKPEIPLTA